MAFQRVQLQIFPGGHAPGPPEKFLPSALMFAPTALTYAASPMNLMLLNVTEKPPYHNILHQRNLLTAINNFLLKFKNSVKEKRSAVLFYNAKD